MRAVLVMSAMSLACARGTGASSTETAVLLEGAGLQKLRIGEATLANAATILGLKTIQWMETSDNGQGEIRTPQLLRLVFLSPENGEGAPVLYAVRANFGEPIYEGEISKGLGYYTGKTTKGIGLLDSLDAVYAAYGPPDTEWVRVSDRVHFYADEGLIFTTRHPKGFAPHVYAAGRAALGKQPDEGHGAAVVGGIIVVQPFTVTQASQSVRAGQQVVSSPPETTLRVAVH